MNLSCSEDNPTDNNTDLYAGDERDFELGNTGVMISMVWVPAGTFQMGSSDTEEGHYSHEGPVHTVTISQGFWIGKYEVTQAQWEAVTGTGDFYFDNHPTHPAEKTSWDDIQEDFIPVVNASETGNPWRLPTEAEWEYAIRAGTTTRFYWGDDPTETFINNHTWYSGTALGMTHPVGQKAPNDWGLYDMSGNVWEWCLDRYDSDYYANSPATDPQGPSSGSSRVLRGGGWGDGDRVCRSAFRSWSGSWAGGGTNGFRLARTHLE